MKKIAILIVTGALLTQSCKQGDYDPKPVDQSTISQNHQLTYSDINGNYRLYDSVYFVKKHTLDTPAPEDMFTISRAIPVSINANTTPSASFLLDGHTYYEDHSLPNEYTAADDYYDIRKVRFVRDSIYMTMYKASYIVDTSLYVTVKGYKL